ncbi:lipid-binding protein [Solitalea koreensis]|uniref:Lipid-binding putative hydrolase n=1 Tax=Solitalea koreensis TaxID=543615 RepID=A0A521C9E1_9SPHI|nr:lipid-binding protein [Solitalea koreensis]SMO55441.1 Lipid-binding putative hydrolase [Solitalea koreensis]
MALVLVAATAITSCEKAGSGDIEYIAPAGKLAGEWFVTVKDKAAPAVIVVNYRQISTFNSANSGNELWIQASGATTGLTGLSSYGVKVRTTADANALTFSAKNGANILTTAGLAPTVNVLSGKVFKGAGKSLTGATVDSIYMEVEYSTKAGKTYIISGHQRSGFPADQPAVK